jgi:tRNA threonylcarbamoyl adenosine modification protein YeaZ
MATAAAYGHALAVPAYGVCSLDAIGVHTAGEVLVVTDARRREVYWARYRDGARVEGPAVGPPADVRVGEACAVAGSGPHAALFDLPRRGPERPTADGLVRAVTEWVVAPPPLVPLYLRRPDAKSIAERAAINAGPPR